MPWEELGSDWRSKLQRRLLKWYDQHGRILPWRNSADPYAVWISEIMLQQTTVAAVIPYFRRFLLRFPDIGSLAAGPEADVLKHWEGLGYYSRARNLFKAAQHMMVHFGGQLPDSVDQLMTLPGIGRYTAGAISSFGFGKQAPIVEANTLRLYSRLIGLTDDPRSTRGQRTLWDFADWLSKTRSAPLLNQALMDLGASVCRPQSPLCDSCPLMQLCTACRDGLQDQIPLPPTKVQKTSVTEILFVVRNRGSYLLRQAIPGERWSGLWDFVRFPIPSEESPAYCPQLPDYRSAIRTASEDRGLFQSCEAELQSAETVPIPAKWPETVRELTGLTLGEPIGLTEIRHVVTRFQISLLCFFARVTRGRVRSGTGYTWYRPAEIAELPLSMTGRKIAELVSARDRLNQAPDD